jgi:hypothetical protein
MYINGNWDAVSLMDLLPVAISTLYEEVTLHNTHRVRI